MFMNWSYPRRIPDTFLLAFSLIAKCLSIYLETKWQKRRLRVEFVRGVSAVDVAYEQSSWDSRNGDTALASASKGTISTLVFVAGALSPLEIRPSLRHGAFFFSHGDGAQRGKWCKEKPAPKNPIYQILGTFLVRKIGANRK